jgi:DNA-binding CsgD family transcriptional regulator
MAGARGGDGRLRISKLAGRAAHLHGYMAGAMRRRLVLYTFALVLLLGALMTGTVMMFGRLSIVEQMTAESLAIQLSVFEHDMAGYFDQVAAHGVKFSKELSSQLESTLKDEGLSFASLNGNPNAIASIEDALFGALRRALELADCSGAYFLLDATANTSLPGADRSKCGMYVKIANVNVSRPADPQLVLYRGYTDVGSARGLSFHNMWSLEFSADVFPYDAAMEKANPDLNSCFLFTDAMKLPGTWERVMLLCVPIVGNDGEAYGICGFEISHLYFKLRHSRSGGAQRLTGILARRGETGLDADSGFECGDRSGYFVELTGMLSSSPLQGFSVYKSGGDAFVGMESPISLSPLEQERMMAVLMPKSDYDAERFANMRDNVVMAILLILSAAFGSAFMSRMYIAPILQGLRQAKSGKAPGRGVNIQEIDDLLLFLQKQDEAREALAAELEEAKRQAQELDEKHETLAAELEKAKRQAQELKAKESASTLNLAGCEQFMKNIATLTKAERGVFDLYMEGLTAEQIARRLFNSIHTIKSHNTSIYRKLGVTSRKELMLYVRMMKEKEDEAVGDG